ncbi:hypothetical protein SAMN04487770_1189 [Butyrivibrio sp. ob235]|nr:hypothetical protein SAMN04487770_1189 [Butyrivibrio sp. ob235]
MLIMWKRFDGYSIIYRLVVSQFAKKLGMDLQLESFFCGIGVLCKTTDV